MDQAQTFLQQYAQEIELVSLFFITNTLIIALIQLLPVLFVLIIHNKSKESFSEELFISSGLAPPVTILTPVFNEEALVEVSVDALLALKYPDYQVIVINDGSSDQTLHTLISRYELEKVDYAAEWKLEHEPVKDIYISRLNTNLLVIDKENGGKADAINAGINVARSDLFCVMDGDTLLEEESLLKIIKPFVDDPEHTIAVGGTVCVLNGCKVRHGIVEKVGLPKTFLELVQVVEYLRAFMIARNGWSRVGMLTLISGAFGVFKKDIVCNIGGYPKGSMGEDMELVMEMHRYVRDSLSSRHHIAAVPEPVCWTEVPSTIRSFCNQRTRWQQGSLETFFNNISILFNPKYGRVGLLSMLVILVVDVLGPVLELFGYFVITVTYAAGILEFHALLAYIGLMTLFGIFTSLLSLWLEERWNRSYKETRSYIKLLFVAIIENIGYRQLVNLLRLVGWLQFLRRKKEWGYMPRKGVQVIEQ
ncbi:glycosyltransferase family 2 protein [Endozoicomonas atrinae]|uniref:glycosyltransferase family 2 protein n=1 Tax=Endozoicomonas atrinae TaxID=1333660 RepID=UPI001EE7505C|nr:glycosyltransferase [Endozoicomonas atrinae]